MTQPAKSQEPSMEEILASIRRIIADDDATKPAPRPPEPPKAGRASAAAAAAAGTAPRRRAAAAVRSRTPAPAESPDTQSADQSADILDLTESMAARCHPPSPSVAPPAAPQFRTIDGSSDVGFVETVEHGRDAAAASEQSRLISDATSAAVDSAFNTLAQTVLVQNARTLEDLVREMLRPMLKSWLDDNLPGMVERLVRAEIERVSRGRDGLKFRVDRQSLAARRRAAARDRTAPPALP